MVSSLPPWTPQAMLTEVTIPRSSSSSQAVIPLSPTSAFRSRRISRRPVRPYCQLLTVNRQLLPDQAGKDGEGHGQVEGWDQDQQRGVELRVPVHHDEDPGQGHQRRTEEVRDPLPDLLARDLVLALFLLLFLLLGQLHRVVVGIRIPAGLGVAAAMAAESG